MRSLANRLLHDALIVYHGILAARHECHLLPPLGAHLSFALA